MKIEIKVLDNIKEKCKGMICFEAPKFLVKELKLLKQIEGTITIDGRTSKFSFNPYFMDGDIFGGHKEDRMIIKTLIPMYIYTHKDKYKR